MNLCALPLVRANGGNNYGWSSKASYCDNGISTDVSAADRTMSVIDEIIEKYKLLYTHADKESAQLSPIRTVIRTFNPTFNTTQQALMRLPQRSACLLASWTGCLRVL